MDSKMCVTSDEASVMSWNLTPLKCGQEYVSLSVENHSQNPPVQLALAVTVERTETIPAAAHGDNNQFSLNSANSFDCSESITVHCESILDMCALTSNSRNVRCGIAYSMLPFR
jgi:hypothetical protein